MTYLLLTGALMVVALGARIVAGVLAARRGAPIPLAPTVLAAITLVVLTAVFDNVMIASGLFAYSDAHITGIRIGLAPIEDFSYPLAIVLLAPAIAEFTRRKRRDDKT